MTIERLPAFRKRKNEQSEHVFDGAVPIFTSVEDNETMSPLRRDEINFFIQNSLVVDYYAPLAYREEHNMKSPEIDGVHPYVISAIDSQNKTSLKFRDCHGLVGVGAHIDGGEVSFMVHCNPTSLTRRDFREIFLRDLTATIRELQSNCETGSIDINSFGGTFAEKNGASSSETGSDVSKGVEYEVIKDELDRLVMEELGMRPLITEGPTTKPRYSNDREHEQHALFNTNDRHLHIIRSGSDKYSGQSFTYPHGHSSDFLETIRLEEKELPKEK